MSDKLDLKTLAPYLPYGLKARTFFRDEKEVVKLECEVTPFNVMNFVNGETCYKPILRPLSDLTKVKIQFEYGEPCTMEEWINGNWSLGQEDWILKDIAKEQRAERILELPYGVISELIEHHFDVFGLIEKGIAIDLKTLNP